MDRSSKVYEQIEKAEGLYYEYSRELLEDGTIVGLLDKYRNAIYFTKKLFTETTVVDACSACAGRNRGSCCFEGMEENYHSILLLINLLLGVKLPNQRELKGHCFFVGGKGCKLLARYYFCVNYFCPELEEDLGSENMRQLSSAIGRELFAGWEVERAIYNWLKCAKSTF